MNDLTQLSWESVVSERVPHMKGMSNLSYESRVKQLTLTDLALRDTSCQDIFMDHFGLKSKFVLLGHGYWEEVTNPVQQTQIALNSDEDIENLKTYAAIKGLLTKQDGVGMHTPYYDEEEIPNGRGLSVSTDRELTEEEFLQIAKSFEEKLSGVACVSAEEGFRVIDFAEELDIEEYHQTCLSILDERIPKDMEYIQVNPFNFEADLLENDWEKNPNGEQYIDIISKNNDPELLKKCVCALEHINQLEKRFCLENSLEHTSINHRIAQELIDKIPEGNIESGNYIPFISEEKGEETQEEYINRLHYYKKFKNSVSLETTEANTLSKEILERYL